MIIKNKDSKCLHDVPRKLLKFANEVLSIPLAQLINFYVELGQFPDARKLEISFHYIKREISQVSRITHLSFFSASYLKLQKKWYPYSENGQ